MRAAVLAVAGFILILLISTVSSSWFSPILSTRETITTVYNSSNYTSPLLLNGTSLVNLTQYIDSGELQPDCDDLILTNDTASGYQVTGFELPNVSGTYGCGDNTEIWVDESLGTENYTLFLYHTNFTGAALNSTGDIWSDYPGVYHFGLRPFENSSTIPNGGTGLEVIGKVPFDNTANNLFGDSVYFNGSPINRLHTVSEINELFGDNMTLEAWVNVTDESAEMIVMDRVNNASNVHFAITILNTKVAHCEIRTSNGLQTLDGNLGIVPNQWTYVACVYNGTHRTLYVNGTISASGTQTGTMAVHSLGNFSVGASPSGTGPFNGSIDEVRVSNVSRDADYIMRTFNNKLGSTAEIDAAANSSCIHEYTVCGGRDARYRLLCGDDDKDGETEWSDFNRTYCEGGCFDGTCQNTIPRCVNQCNVTVNQLACAGSRNNYVINCTSDSNGCNVWNPDNRTFCQYGCSEGQCLNGTSQCFSGASRCFGNQILPCRDTNGDSLFEWDITNATLCTNECFTMINDTTGLEQAFCEFGSGNLSVIYGLGQALESLGFEISIIFPDVNWRAGFLMAFIIIIWGMVTWISTWHLGTVAAIGISAAGLFMGWLPFYIAILFIFMGGLLLFLSSRGNNG